MPHEVDIESSSINYDILHCFPSVPGPSYSNEVSSLNILHHAEEYRLRKFIRECFFPPAYFDYLLCCNLIANAVLAIRMECLLFH